MKQKIELSNSYVIEGPVENLEKATVLVATLEREMQTRYNETLQFSGESAAMDARDDVYEEYLDDFKSIGFQMID
jgi:hypothetical protein